MLHNRHAFLPEWNTDLTTLQHDVARTKPHTQDLLTEHRCTKDLSKHLSESAKPIPNLFLLVLFGYLWGAIAANDTHTRPIGRASSVCAIGG